jgi:iron complex outermembrane receptor protein
MNSRKQKIKKTKPISMKLQFILHILIPLSLINNSIFAQELQGTVKDIQTKELLPGATLYIPDLKTGAITDLNGH